MGAKSTILGLGLAAGIALGGVSEAKAELKIDEANNTITYNKITYQRNEISDEVLALLQEAEKYGVVCTGDMKRGPRQDICEASISNAELDRQIDEKFEKITAVMNKL